jgi:hypothetical protein
MELRTWSDDELDAMAEQMAQNVERMRAASERDVIAAMIECGCPRRDAEQQLKHSGLAVFARQFYLDYLDAQLGNSEAKQRLERVREGWGQLTQRREEQR